MTFEDIKQICAVSWILAASLGTLITVNLLDNPPNDAETRRLLARTSLVFFVFGWALVPMLALGLIAGFCVGFYKTVQSAEILPARKDKDALPKGPSAKQGALSIAPPSGGELTISDD